jgi:hypothetical protein
LKEVRKLHLAEQSGQSTEFSPHDSKGVRAMKIARRSFSRYAEAYKALAKTDEADMAGHRHCRLTQTLA